MPVRVVHGEYRNGGHVIYGNIHVTRRELDVLALIGNGLEIEESAEKLGVRPQTVKNHLFKVMKKLNAKSRVHAMVKAIEQDMLDVKLIDECGVVSIEPELGKSEYKWCLHCERTYKWDEFRHKKMEPFIVNHVKYEPEFYLCPYPDCNGNYYGDGWDWDYMREHHPEYPEIPEHDVVYPLYPTESEKK